MNHRIISAMVGLVAAFLLAAGTLFSITIRVVNKSEQATSGAVARAVIPPITHAVDESTTNCLNCHEAADGKMPASHRTYSLRTCLTCHAVKGGETM